jgi:hypothetical protein
MATSLLALIEWWLENKLSPPPAHMGKIYKALIIDATDADGRSESNTGGGRS